MSLLLIIMCLMFKVQRNIACTYSQFLAQRTPTYCVSLSSFYNKTIVGCPTCTCGCQNNKTESGACLEWVKFQPLCLLVLFSIIKSQTLSLLLVTPARIHRTWRLLSHHRLRKERFYRHWCSARGTCVPSESIGTWSRTLKSSGEWRSQSQTSTTV